MAKRNDNLNWINLNATEMTGDMKKAWDKLADARDAFKGVVEANARKVKALGEGERLLVTLKPWGCGIAKVQGKANTSTNGNPFAAL